MKKKKKNSVERISGDRKTSLDLSYDYRCTDNGTPKEQNLYRKRREGTI